ncbi:hypothetical protein DW219_11455 [Desulfovibrio sp. AM18-2]|nr:hypothetical protein DW219_11455 [Desulfovibrio sp. AM18-2]
MRPLAKLFPQEMGRADAGRGRGCLRQDADSLGALCAPSDNRAGAGGTSPPLAAEGRAPGSIKR